MKRFLAGLIALCIAFPTAVAADAAPIPYGDLNGDGAETAADAAIVLRAAAGQLALDSLSSAASDVTGNMRIDGVDASAILLKGIGSLDEFSDLGGLLSGDLLKDRHIDRFSYQGTIMTSSTYRSDRVSVAHSVFPYGAGICHVMDIYIRDIRSFGTAFSSGTYRGERQRVQDIMAGTDAIVAVNGDLYVDHHCGPIVRNGIWYTETVVGDADLCVFYRDGRMVTFGKGVTMEEIRAFGEVYHTFSAGPMLLDDDGTPLKSFHCSKSMWAQSNRTAIGYFEPGHYCFVTVGSPDTVMTGVTMRELAEIMSNLGCKTAYNLSGGRSATMIGKSGIIVQPSGLPRYASDILYIAEPMG